MSIIYPALGTAIVVAGGDKLAGEGSYKRMFRGLAGRSPTCVLSRWSRSSAAR